MHEIALRVAAEGVEDVLDHVLLVAPYGVLEVPDGFNGELDAHTGDGRVSMHDITLNNVTGQVGKNSVRGRLGSGGHAVRVRTGDGSITLRRF